MDESDVRDEPMQDNAEAESTLSEVSNPSFLTQRTQIQIDTHNAQGWTLGPYAPECPCTSYVHVLRTVRTYFVLNRTSRFCDEFAMLKLAERDVRVGVLLEGGGGSCSAGQVDGARSSRILGRKEHRFCYARKGGQCAVVGW